MYSLNLAIRKTAAGWRVEAETSEPGLAVGTRASAPLDGARLTGLTFPLNLAELREYGKILGQAVFVGDVRNVFHEVLSHAPSGDVLHVMLAVEDQELNSYRWERMCYPVKNRTDSDWEFLHLNQKTPFALDLRSTSGRRYPAISRVGLKALVVVYDLGPTRPYGLVEFDATQTVAGIRAAVGERISCRILAGSVADQLPDADGPPTLDAICQWLTKEDFTILHMVCHGACWPKKVTKDCGHVDTKEAFLFLRKPGEIDDEKTDDHVVRVPADEFLRRLGQIHYLPHLTFLCSCSSANPKAERRLEGLAQRMVRDLAIPAVVAMTDPVPIELGQELSAEFYERLRESGEVDTALAQACAKQAGKPEILIPILFSSLAGRRLFDDQSEITIAEWEQGLKRLPELIHERAPTLNERFEKVRQAVEPALEIRRSSERSSQVTEAAARARDLLAREKAALNDLCFDFLENSFDQVGKDLPLLLPTYDNRCPFPGLGIFDKVKIGDKVEDFRPFFFGRERLTDKIRELLEKHNFVAVLGGSGSGKSSLVRAGVLHALRKNQPELNAIVFPPGKDPLARLNTELHVVKKPDILVVDQFEELFTLCADPKQRREFLATLLPLREQFKVVLTMRADFLGECADHDDLHHLLNSTQPKCFELIQPLKGNELRAVVEQQLRAVGLKFEPGLAAQIFSDLEDEPGAMPLLQHCLRQLWQRRRGRWLRLAEYGNDDGIAGVKGAISRTAEELYSELSAQERELLRYIFERLTAIDADSLSTQSMRDTRRRETLDNLTPAGVEKQTTKLLVNRLADRTLVVTSINPQTNETEVEVAHESLIRHWDKLQNWLADARNIARVVSRVRSDAKQFFAGGENPADLSLQGSNLEQALKILKSPPSRFSASEVEFINKCQNHAAGIGYAKELETSVIAYIKDNFATKSELNQFVRYAFSCDIEAIAPGDLTIAQLAEHFVRWAQKQGKLTKLLNALVQHTKEAPDQIATISRQHFEGGIDYHVPFIDIHHLVSTLSSIERKVCRVNLRDRMFGTGFLVADDLVLTAYHVLESVIVRNEPADDVVFEFDYWATSTGVERGVLAKLHPTDWLADFSSYAEGEKFGNADLVPNPDQLDYALVRLAEPLGAMPWSLENPANVRGFVSLPTTRLEIHAGEPLMIVQHPGGKPLKLSLSTTGVQSVNQNKTRIRYSVRTEPGSSGAPCVDLAGNLVAIHHYGDPKGRFKQGIPIQAVLERLQRLGKAQLVGVPTQT